MSTTNSRGSIRPKNGGWELRVYLGRDFDGKPQQASRSVQGSRAEAEAALTEMVEDIEANGPGAARPSTFTDLFVRRMKIDDELEESTARGYWSWFRNHIEEAIGPMPVLRITTVALNDYYRELRKELAIGSVRNVHTVISSTFSFGVSEGFGGLRVNPAAAARVGKGTRQRIAAPTVAKVRLALDPSEHENGRFLLACRLAVATGARRGEICGLRWDDLDDDGQLHIRRSIYVKAGPRLYVKATKTERERSLSLDADTLAMLRRSRTTLVPDHYILSGGPRPYNPDHLTAAWEDLREHLGMEGVRFHDLRHFHATQLLNARIPIVNVSRRLGHAAVSTTLDIYADWVKERDDESAEVIATLMQGRDSA